MSASEASKPNRGVPEHLPKRLAIDMPLWRWLTDRLPGEEYADLDGYFAKLVERGYNTSRVDAMLHWAYDHEGNVRGPVEVGGVMEPGFCRNSGAMATIGGFRVRALDELLAMFGIAEKHGVYLLLTGWEYQPAHTTTFAADEGLQDEITGIPAHEKLMALAYLVLYLVTTTAVTRIRAEVGSPVHGLHWAGPEELMVDAMGTRAIGRSNLMVMSFFWFMSRAHYSDVMPQQLEGFRMGSRARMNLRHVVIALLIASVIGVVVAFVVLVDAGYRSGQVALPWGGTEPMNRLQRWITNPAPPDPYGVGLFASGVSMVVVMTMPRSWFVWWPFHPVGFAVSLSGSWFMFLLAWLIKYSIVKQGGIVGLRRATPLFMGLILGEFIIGGAWALFGVLIEVRTFSLTAWW